MLIIPAIDIRGGRCVRLYQGSYAQETVYYDDPVKMSKLWRIQNAKVLHVVDLDAARGGDANNAAIIADICQCLDIPVQVGGGLRTLDDIEQALAHGVYRVVLGTAAVRNPDLVSEAIARFGKRRVAVGIDARDGEVRVEGWTEGSGLDAVAFAQDMERRGCCRIIYTDISRDGTLAGPNIEAYRTLAAHLSPRTRITSSGGVGGYRDLLALMPLKPQVDSVIIGRALYENKFPCQQTWCWHQKDDLDIDCFSTAGLNAQAEATPAADAAPGDA